MKRILCASMMCADFGHLEKEIQELEAAGIDIFHIDIMDGKFVPNFGMGLQDVEYICRHTAKQKEIHLMIEEPARYAEKFIKLGADIIYIHPEADYHPATVLQQINELGGKAGIVLSPGTSVESVIELLKIVDYVMVMAVNPGHAGQIYLPFIAEKIQKLQDCSEKYGFEVEVDGACSLPRIKEFCKIGVSRYVLGTAGLFFKDGRSYKEIIQELREEEEL